MLSMKCPHNVILNRHPELDSGQDLHVCKRLREDPVLNQVQDDGSGRNDAIASSDC